MRGIDKLRLRLRSIFYRKRVEAELDRELQFHLDRQIEENLDAGLGPDEARQAALRSIGRPQSLKEECRETRGLRFFDTLRQDLGYALRSLRKNPGFTAVAVGTMALGIGATSAMFSLGDGLLLRPLPVSDPSGVVRLVSRSPSGTFGGFSYPDYLDYRDRLESFDSLIAYRFVQAAFAVASEAQAEMQTGFAVTGNFFDALDVRPAIGRGFLPEENASPGRDAVIVIGHDLWRTRFLADPAVIGSDVRLNGVDFEIVGVAPETFKGMDQLVRPAFFIPVMMGPRLGVSGDDFLEARGARFFSVNGRLKRGVSRSVANAEAATLARVLEEAYPLTNRGYGALVRTELQARTAENPTDAVLVASLFALAMVVLAIACANLAGMMLARGRSRTRELAIRRAVGATGARLVRQLMTESVLIALAGGLVGLSIAGFAVDVFSTIEVPNDFPIEFQFELDDRVLMFTLLASVASALLFGLVPAFRSSRTGVAGAIKTGESDPARGRLAGRRALVTVQVAGSLALLSTTLLAAAIPAWRAAGVDPVDALRQD